MTNVPTEHDMPTMPTTELSPEAVAELPTREIADLVQKAGADPSSFVGQLIAELITTSLKLIRDQHDSGQLKLISRSLKEMRYAYLVFNKYRGTRKVAIFGSARTPQDHPDYAAAKDFSRAISEAGWMAITGAGDGIMKAGHEGPPRESSFGLSIRLPFETTANTVIEGDPKLINFRYFFTRKLMFLTHSDAVAVFPGGFGTQDELFESLTLVQTGKSNIVPVVLVEHPGGTYWQHWDRYIRESLLGSGLISPEDPALYHIATSVEDAVEHTLRFYRLYHSSRYVGPTLVIRLNQPITPEQLDRLNTEFASLVKTGSIEQTSALPQESDHRELPRLVFHHTRRNFGLVRTMIDRINDFAAYLPEN